MAKIDKHGIRIRGLKAAAGYITDCKGCTYYKIFYNRNTHEVWAVFYYESPHEVRTFSMLKEKYKGYDDPRIILICRTKKHMTMQEIADKVYERVEFFKDLEFVKLFMDL